MGSKENILIAAHFKLNRIQVVSQIADKTAWGLCLTLWPQFLPPFSLLNMMDWLWLLCTQTPQILLPPGFFTLFKAQLKGYLLREVYTNHDIKIRPCLLLLLIPTQCWILCHYMKLPYSFTCGFPSPSAVM